MSEWVAILQARRWWAWVAIALLGGTAVALVLVNTSRHGVGISPDSTGYLSAARNLLCGRGYTCYDGSPYAAWPPLFPTLLAGLGLLGVEPAVGARLLNALAFGAVVALSGHLFLRSLRSPALAVIASAAVAVFFPMLRISSMAWTEPVFLLLVLLFAYQARAFQQRPRLRSLVLLAVLAALCSLQRYTGVALIMAGFVLVCFAPRGTGASGRAKAMACYTVIACMPLALWMGRNYALTSMFTGHPRISSIYSLGQNVIDAADTATAWFVPDLIALDMRGPLVALLALLVLAVLALRLYDMPSGTGPARGVVAAAGVVIAIYLPLILYTHQVGVRDEIMNDRYLAPVSILVLWCLFLAADGVWTLLGLLPARAALVRHSVPCICALWLIYPVTQVADIVRQGLDQGAGGYSREDWQTLPFVRWLREHPLNGRVRCNAPDAYYALLGSSVYVSPHRSWDLDDFQQSVSGEPNEYLVWFGNVHREFLHDRRALIAALYLEHVATVWDSGVYRLRPSTALPFADSRLFTDCLTNGAWSRTFTSERYGHRGIIRSWLMRADGATDSVWELHAGNGRVLRWAPSGRFTRSNGGFAFQCRGLARESARHTTAPYTLSVDGRVDGTVASGTYRITFDHPQWPPADRGTWSVRLTRPVYRLYSHVTGRHLYTTSLDDVNARAAPGSKAWADEGVAFCVYSEPAKPPGAVPVFGFSSRHRDLRFYTMDAGERDRLRDDESGVWEDQGIAWYAFSEETRPPDALPVYRFWSNTAGAHFYTIHEAEKHKLLGDTAVTWAYEGVAWYAIPPEPPAESAPK
jgi:hypothetical protein